MANITELDQFDANVYSLAIIDAALGGTGGNANKQAQNLANRTRYIYNRINPAFQQLNPTFTVAANTVENVNGVAYTPTTYPLPFPDFTTPNDGITRKWDIRLSWGAAWTEGSYYMALRLYTVSNVPAYSELARCQQKEGTLGYFTSNTIITLPPNTPVSVAIQNGSGASVTFDNVQVLITEF